MDHLLHQIVDFVLPPACALCRHPGAALCQNCLRKMKRIDPDACAICGRPRRAPGADHHACQDATAGLVSLQALFWYDPAVAPAIHQLKYRGMFGLARTLGDEMAARWPTAPADLDLIIPIPLHPRRQQERGFNQSALLARRLAYAWRLPVNETAVTRHRETAPQARLAASLRQKNVAGAFRADPAAVQGRRVGLIDDVYTTGSTLQAAAEALMEAGAQSVAGYCLARAQPVNPSFIDQNTIGGKHGVEHSHRKHQVDAPSGSLR